MSQTMNDLMEQQVPVFQTYREVEQAVMAAVEKEIINGRFLKTLHNGGYSAAQIREFALQYSYYSRNFPRVLGAAVAAVEPLDRWWVPLVDNLWDEAGRGNPKGYHSKMYRTFLESVAPDVAVSDEHVPDYPVGGATQKAVKSFLSFLKSATTLEAMAAVGLGSELFAGLVMGEIGQGLRHPNYNQETRVNVGFWMAHADEHEPRHYQLCKDVLLDFSSPEELQTIYRAGLTIALSEARFYDELYEEMIAK